jgi:hypothetical protein
MASCSESVAGCGGDAGIKKSMKIRLDIPSNVIAVRIRNILRHH